MQISNNFYNPARLFPSCGGVFLCNKNGVGYRLKPATLRFIFTVVC